MSGTFTSDILGFMVYEDADRLPLGLPSKASFTERCFQFWWPPKRVHRTGTAHAIALVTASGAVTVVSIGATPVSCGDAFHGTVTITVGKYLEVLV